MTLVCFQLNVRGALAGLLYMTVIVWCAAPVDSRRPRLGCRSYLLGLFL